MTHVLALFLEGKLVSRYTVSDAFTQDVLSDLYFAATKPALSPADQQVWDHASQHDFDECEIYPDA